MSFEENKVENAKKPFGIKNDKLRKAYGSDHLRCNLVYGKDYTIVPPRVWKAFVNWYGKSFEI